MMLTGSIVKKIMVQESTILWSDGNGGFSIQRPGAELQTPDEAQAVRLLEEANRQLDTKHGDNPEPYATESLERRIPVVIFERYLS